MNTLLSFHPFRVASRALFVAVLFPAAASFAGPPLICHPYDIATAKSLPGGNDGHGVSKDYDRTHLIGDTLALLTPDTPIIVRMETLRRAAIYATSGLRDWDKGIYTAEDRGLGLGLLEQLRERSRDAGGPARAVALFDLGFFAETFRQTQMDPALDGYPFLLKAAELRPADAEIAFALAIASANPHRMEQASHLARARAGAQRNPLLAANLESHFDR